MAKPRWVTVYKIDASSGEAEPDWIDASDVRKVESKSDHPDRSWVTMADGSRFWAAGHMGQVLEALNVPGPEERPAEPPGERPR